MTKFKEGDRVQINGYKGWKKVYNGKVGIVLDDDSNVPHVAISGVVESVPKFFEDKLTKVEPSIDTLCVGDVIEEKDGMKRKVLAMQGDLCGLSNFNGHKEYFGWCTKHQLKEKEYTFSHHEDGLVEQEVEADEKTELTLKEVAEKFGVDVDALRIKDNEK